VADFMKNVSNVETYPYTYNRPVPLKDWIKSKGLTYRRAAHHFGFQPVAIQKMISSDRDVGVWTDDQLVETKRIHAKAVHTCGKMLGWPKPQDVILTVKLEPRGKMLDD
tara:strand:- start:10 stop:336 length:327 start_codon:yes stop_codon:yes gene_type:complete